MLVFGQSFCRHIGLRPYSRIDDTIDYINKNAFIRETKSGIIYGGHPWDEIEPHDYGSPIQGFGLPLNS